MEQAQCIIMIISLGLSVITNQPDLKEFTYQAENHMPIRPDKGRCTEISGVCNL